MSTVATFTIEHTCFLDRDGRPGDMEFPPFAARPVDLVPHYRRMVLTRTFDAKAIALQRTGQLGTYASSLGQEAVGAGVGAAMQPEDVLVPTYREQATQLARGVTMTELLTYWGGDERGSDYAVPREDFPVCIPIATQCCHAVGVATAIRIRGQDRAVVCMCGDGATSKGDFYEATNLAGVWGLPVVFVVSNNQWAISVPRAAQSAAGTLAQKAVAAGFPGEQVDGNDFIAVRWAVENALARARGGGGPSLVEALTYRLHDHTTADDASRYRDDAQVSEHWKDDPLARVREYLAYCGVWTKADEEALLADCRRQVEEAVAACQSMAPEPATAMFDHLYAELPAALAPQRARAAAEQDDG